MSGRKTRVGLLLAFFMCLLVMVYQPLLLQQLVGYASTSPGTIDVYTQKKPHDGRNPNQASDAFSPQEAVSLFAEVLYNDYPVTNVLVAFEISGPVNPIHNVTLSRTETTNASGVASMSFRLPWPDEDAETIVFGLWTVYVGASIAEVKVQDTLTFIAGWIVDIDSLMIVNTGLQPQIRFSREADVGVELWLRNIAMLPRVATLTIAIYDNLSYQIGSITLEDFELPPGDTYLHCVLTIPTWAELDQAMVGAAVFTAPLAEGGVAYCPWTSTTFLITWCDVAVIGVSPSATAVDTGDIVNVTVQVANEGFEMESFTLSAYCNQLLIEELQVTDVAPSDEREYTFAWNTSDLAVGDYTVSASVSVVPGEIDVADNLLVDGVVMVGAPVPSQPVSAFPVLLLIVLLVAVGAVICTMASAIYYKKGRVEKGWSRFSTRSFASDTKNAHSSKGKHGSDGNALSSAFSIADLREETVSSLREPFASESRNTSPSIGQMERNPQKQKGESISNPSYKDSLNGGKPARPFILAVVDLSRLRRKQSYF